jgi:hypothetical protein
VLQDVSPVVSEAVQYVRRRLPQDESRVVVRERYEEVPPINLNRALVKQLDLQMVQFKPDMDFDGFSGIVLVDSQSMGSQTDPGREFEAFHSIISLHASGLPKQINESCGNAEQKE